MYSVEIKRKSRRHVSRRQKSKRSRRQRSRKHVGGNPPPAWAFQRMQEALRLQQEATRMDQGKHDLLIAGSMAVLFHVANTPGMEEDFQHMAIPSDLDFKYEDTGEPLFVNAVQTRPVAGGGILGLSMPSFGLQTQFNEDPETCPEYVDLDVFRCCAPIDHDVTFKPRGDGTSVFESVDFTTFPQRRRPTDPHWEGVTFYVGGEPVRVLALSALHYFYKTFERGPANIIKRNILHRVAQTRSQAGM